MANTGNQTRPALTKYVDFNFPKAQLIVQIKPSPYESQWVTFAEFDLKVKQRFRVGITKLDFVNRALGFSTEGPCEIAVEGRFTGPYAPTDTQLDSQEVGRIFRRSWESGSLLTLLREVRSADVALGV
jgi:hypothetical protein